MAVSRQRKNVSYGISSALLDVPAAPIVGIRAPTTSDMAEIGTTWINTSTDIAYVLTSIVSNSATWGSTTSSGTAAVVGSLLATTGNITAALGDIVATAGDVTVSAGNIDVTLGGITVATGNIAATLGSVLGGTTVTATTDLIAVRSAFIGGDEGTGIAASLGLTNVVDTTLSTGAGVVLMKTANPGDSSGWLKIYYGTDVRYIPYWTNLSP